ncbi:hypothetical protein EFW17_10570 [Halostreptopolyspora alba]|uniref:Uncharacterized protein n=2 Tax=Halostreptopolyspora alba TaxID=2487137 RepID=A0A3N0EA92_9ACTN|nr:hypothetical protein EFW17_10570 [Nocardiopsaceae bacterium YIM 96095]
MLGEKLGILGTTLVIIGVGWFTSSRMRSDLRFSVTSMLSGATIPLVIVSSFLWPLEKNYDFEGALGIVGRMDSYFGVPSSPFMMVAFVAIGSWLVYGVVTVDQWEHVEARQKRADSVPRRDGYAFMFNITYFVLFGVVAAWFFSLGGGWTALAIGVTLLLLPTSVFALDALKLKRRDAAGIPIEDGLASFRWTKS